MLRVISLFLVASCSATSLVFAAPDQEAQPAQEETTFPIQTATCADVFDLFADASPGEGKDPQALEEAQDEVLYFVTWVHGYLSGRYGIDQEKRPMSKKGIEIVIGEMAEICEPDKSKLFLEAVEGLKE